MACGLLDLIDPSRYAKVAIALMKHVHLQLLVRDAVHGPRPPERK